MCTFARLETENILNIYNNKEGRKKHSTKTTTNEMPKRFEAECSCRKQRTLWVFAYAYYCCFSLIFCFIFSIVQIVMCRKKIYLLLDFHHFVVDVVFFFNSEIPWLGRLSRTLIRFLIWIFQCECFKWYMIIMNSWLKCIGLAPSIGLNGLFQWNFHCHKLEEGGDGEWENEQFNPHK